MTTFLCRRRGDAFATAVLHCPRNLHWPISRACHFCGSTPLKADDHEPMERNRRPIGEAVTAVLAVAFAARGTRNA
jgi:hypothetical protein